MTTPTETEDSKTEWLRNVIKHIKASPDHTERSLKAISTKLGKDYAHLNHQVNGNRRVSDSILESIFQHYGFRFKGTPELSQPEQPVVGVSAGQGLPIYEITIRMQGVHILGTSSRIVAN